MAGSSVACGVLQRPDTVSDHAPDGDTGVINNLGIRTIGCDGVIAWMRALGALDDGDRDRTAWTVRAILADAGFARRDPRMPLVGIRRWFAGSSRRILFIAAGEPHGACRSVAAAVACIVAHETDRDRTVVIAAHREDVGRGEPIVSTRWEEVTIPKLLLTTLGSC